MDELLEEDRNRDDAIRVFEEEVKPELSIILKEMIEKDMEGELVLAEAVPAENAVQSVRDHLENREYEELARLIITLDSFNNETRKTLSIGEQCMYFEFLIKTYMFDHTVSFALNATQVAIELQNGVLIFNFRCRARSWM